MLEKDSIFDILPFVPSLTITRDPEISMISLITIITIISTISLASPLTIRDDSSSSTQVPFLNTTSIRCPINPSDLLLPNNQTALAIPDGLSPVYVTIGRGIQNYTCTSNGTWKSIGAIAQLFDISCLSPNTSSPFSFVTISTEAYNTPFDVTQDQTSVPTYLGEHTFVIANETNIIEPKFDFGTVLNDVSQYVIGNKTGSVVSPDDPLFDVAWLQLTALEGDLASTVFRVSTHGGVPPTSCGTVSDLATLSVPYAAQYWFFK